MLNDLVFQRANGGRVKIPTRIQETIFKHKQTKCWHAESGGVIVGRFINEADYIFDDVTTPSIYDVRSRFKFFRRSEIHQDFVNNVWSRSGGGVNYLGEWHTHPEMIPTPSFTDEQNWRKIAKRVIFEGDVLFFLIVGIRELGLWEINKNGDISLLNLC